LLGIINFHLKFDLVPLGVMIMKNPKSLKTIASILTVIIVIFLAVNFFLVSNKKGGSVNLITNNSSETTLSDEETKQELYSSESDADNNSVADESKTNLQTKIESEISKSSSTSPILSKTNDTQIKTAEQESLTEELTSSEADSAEIDSSTINEQMFSEITDNIIQPAIDSFNGEIDIYFEILNHDLIFATQKDPMYPASLAKLFLTGTIFQSIEDGIIEYDKNIAYDLQIMITESDNAAFNRLFYQLQDAVPERNMFDFVDDFCMQNNFNQTTIHSLMVINGNERLIYPTDYVFESSALDVGRFMSMVCRGELVNAEASQKMYELLSAQERTWKIPALLPNGAITANKTGELDSLSHDAAIIKSPNCDYVLTIMTDSPDAYQADLLMQDLSLEIYNYLNP